MALRAPAKFLYKLHLHLLGVTLRYATAHSCEPRHNKTECWLVSSALLFSVCRQDEPAGHGAWGASGWFGVRGGATVLSRGSGDPAVVTHSSCAKVPERRRRATLTLQLWRLFSSGTAVHPQRGFALSSSRNVQSSSLYSFPYYIGKAGQKKKNRVEYLHFQ